MEITREFYKEFPLYFYTIYTIHRWSMLWQPLIIKTNSNMTSKSLSRISSGNYKRT